MGVSRAAPPNALIPDGLGFPGTTPPKFLELYQARKLIEGDPFAGLDTVGVGALIKMGVERGRAAKPDLKVGICGEHGGDPSFGVVTLW